MVCPLLYYSLICFCHYLFHTLKGRLMEIFIVAFVTGLGIIGGMLLIWKGNSSIQVSTIRSEVSAPTGPSRKEKSA